MPIYEYACADCNTWTELLRTYEERNDQVVCECGGDMVYKLSPPILKGHKRITPPSVGPMTKGSRAYEKKRDDENSKYYAPGDTFGTGGVAGFKKRQEVKAQMDQGQTRFTK